MSCTVKDQCTKAKYGKGVQRSEYQHYINNNKERIEQNKDYYRRRQAIVEHPYGTIKRQWGFSYILTKKFIKRAEADVGLMFTAYNLRRIFNILGKENLSSYLKELALVFPKIFNLFRPRFGHFKASYFFRQFSAILYGNPLNMLIFNRN